MKKRIVIVYLLLLLLLSGCGQDAKAYFDTAGATSEEAAFLEETESGGAGETETEPGEEPECYVYVCGAVNSPGVYSLPAGSRIYEAVRLAGGLREDAREDGVNQAEQVADGQMVRIPARGEAEAESGGGAEAAAGSDGKIDINAADLGALMTLPGIGESKAASIIAYREESGGFSSIEEIKNIAGIKEGVFSKIKDYITVH